MKNLGIGMAVALLLAASTAVAMDKVAICHVGNVAGPNGETYDPYCVPNDANDYFCPDAGKIDLIVVPENAASNHLDNPSHYWDGWFDYDPLAEGATGEGTEDANGDGIDDGCEIPDKCPCWDVSDLQVVTEGNLNVISCSVWIGIYPLVAAIATKDDPPSRQGFWSQSLADGTECGIIDEEGNFDLMPISPAEHDVCVAQIAQRCADIGFPITP